MGLWYLMPLSTIFQPYCGGCDVVEKEENEEVNMKKEVENVAEKEEVVGEENEKERRRRWKWMWKREKRKPEYQECTNNHAVNKFIP